MGERLIKAALVSVFIFFFVSVGTVMIYAANREEQVVGEGIIQEMKIESVDNFYADTKYLVKINDKWYSFYSRYYYQFEIGDHIIILIKYLRC